MTPFSSTTSNIPHACGELSPSVKICISNGAGHFRILSEVEMSRASGSGKIATSTFICIIQGEMIMNFFKTMMKFSFERDLSVFDCLMISFIGTLTATNIFWLLLIIPTIIFSQYMERRCVQPDA